MSKFHKIQNIKKKKTILFSNNTAYKLNLCIFCMFSEKLCNRKSLVPKKNILKMQKKCYIIVKISIFSLNCKIKIVQSNKNKRITLLDHTPYKKIKDL